MEMKTLKAKKYLERRFWNLQVGKIKINNREELPMLAIPPPGSIRQRSPIVLPEDAEVKGVLRRVSSCPSLVLVSGNMFKM